MLDLVGKMYFASLKIEGKFNVDEPLTPYQLWTGHETLEIINQTIGKSTNI